MFFKKTIIYIVILLSFLLIQDVLFAAGGKNLALGRKVEYAPEPKLPLTVHSRDRYLLTDGLKEQGLRSNISPEKTVGWEKVRLIEIKIDLGRIYPVGAVHIHTLGGGRHYVETAEYIVAATSLDGQRYRPASFSINADWRLNIRKLTPKTLVLPLEQKTRYLKLFIRPIGLRFLIDEIEVIESEHLDTHEGAGDYLSKEETVDLVERARQLQRDSNELFEKMTPSATGTNDSESKRPAMEETIRLLPGKLSEDRVFRAESEFARWKASYLKKQYKADWFCYPTDPMEILRYGDLPPGDIEDFDISFYQWKNEYGSATVNLVNCSNFPIEFKLDISPLNLSDEMIVSKDIFEIRRALYVRVVGAGLVANPLVLQNSKPFPVAPGETVQIWLEADSKGLEAGEYTAALAIRAEGQTIQNPLKTIPIHLEVADQTFPDNKVSELPILTCNWSHVTVIDRFTSKHPSLVKDAINDLKEHYTNVFVLRIDMIRGPNRQGLSLQKLSKELGLRQEIRPFVLFDMMGKRPWIQNSDFLENRMFGAFRSKTWESNFRFYLKRFRDYMLSQGYGYDNFALYPYDEYIGEDFVYVAQMIRKFDPKLKIYANKWFESDEQFKQIRNLIDIWCPYFYQVLGDRRTFDRYKKGGDFDRVWCYTTSLYYERYYAPPVIQSVLKWYATDRKEFWRFAPITAKAMGLQGVGFWVYQETFRTEWMEGRYRRYAPVFNGTLNPDKNCYPESIIPSKFWQQWRQGVEDAVCLSGHEDLLDEFFRKPGSELSSAYLTSLRKRADGKLTHQ